MTGQTSLVDKLTVIKRMGAAERDLFALGIAIAAIILFIATGGQVLPDVVRSLLGQGSGPDKILANALLLNIALIIFGWRRYRELTKEIAERKRAEEIARQLAETDPLTGCLNRRSMARAANALREKSNTNGQSIAFFMIDLDNFKQINDMNGHSAGDRILTKIGQTLQKSLPADASIARLGGDEFAIVLPFDKGKTHQVDDRALGLFETIGRALEKEGISVDVTMSMGLASDQDEGIQSAAVDFAETLMHRADIAMYQAKKQGKNRYVWFEPTMENELRFRNELETGVRRGLANAEFVPFYEQQIDLETGNLVGFEMLARWDSPQLGLVKPDIFIPIAEEIGAIAELSEQLMERAFADAQEWDPKLTLAVNISPVQLRDPWFAQKLLKLLVKNNFPTHRLEIEITESCLHQDVGMVRAMIASLKNQGVRISLDDFGTGYSSLAQLRSLPFDRIKIDRSFIAELGNTEGSNTIVDAIISLGNGLKMPITAEGIENERTLTALKRMGQLKGQGYLYGHPETAKQVMERLNKRGLLNKSISPDKVAEKQGSAKKSHSEVEGFRHAMKG